MGFILDGVRQIYKNEPTPDTHLQCPDCAELVRKEARVCKHCGAKLKPESPA
jgi:hypothetical protein